MNFTLLLSQYAPVLLILFAIGCLLSWMNERRRIRGVSVSKGVGLLEWVLLIPGYAVIFVWLHERGVLVLVANTGIGLTLLFGVVLLSLGMILLKRKRPSLTTSSLAGLFGTPFLVFALLMLGQFVFSQDRFEELRTTHSNLKATEGVAAPDFEFTLVKEGIQAQLEDYRGKVLLVNVWATWCGPCLVEMPALDRLQKQYQSEGLVVLNLSDEPQQVIKGFLEKNPMSTVHGRIADRKSIPDFYQFGKARPTTFVIDREGTVVETLAGGKSYKVFEKVVTKLL